MKTKYIHIGMPKNLSTTLQRDFFNKHPEVFHLGVGVGSNVDYVNPQIASACENHFQYSKNFSYNRVKTQIKEAFEAQFEEFKKNKNKKACGISLELLSFTFTPDQIEIEEKVKRVFNAFGENTKIILIIRQQKDLIESLYKEAIKIGYYGTFQDYLKYIYYSRDRNFIFDFQYDYLYNLYGSYFGKENVNILCIEHFRDSNGHLIYDNGVCLLTEKLSEIIAVNSQNLDLSHYNKALSLKELITMRDLNKINVHGIGNQTYSTGTNFHRLKHYFRDELGVAIEDEILYKDARNKNINIEKAQTVTDTSDKLLFSYPKEIHSFLKQLFEESNRRLEKETNIKLPNSYLDFN